MKKSAFEVMGCNGGDNYGSVNHSNDVNSSSVYNINDSINHKMDDDTSTHREVDNSRHRWIIIATTLIVTFAFVGWLSHPSANNDKDLTSGFQTTTLSDSAPVFSWCTDSPCSTDGDCCDGYECIENVCNVANRPPTGKTTTPYPENPWDSGRRNRTLLRKVKGVLKGESGKY